VRCFFGKEFEGFLAASACDVSADSYCFCSAAPPPEPFGLSLSKPCAHPTACLCRGRRPGCAPPTQARLFNQPTQPSTASARTDCPTHPTDYPARNPIKAVRRTTHHANNGLPYKINTSAAAINGNAANTHPVNNSPPIATPTSNATAGFTNE